LLQNQSLQEKHKCSATMAQFNELLPGTRTMFLFRIILNLSKPYYLFLSFGYCIESKAQDKASGRLKQCVVIEYFVIILLCISTQYTRNNILLHCFSVVYNIIVNNFTPPPTVDFVLFRTIFGSKYELQIEEILLQRRKCIYLLINSRNLNHNNNNQ